MSKPLPPKHQFETTLRAFRTETGTHPFLRDVWHGLLNCDEVLSKDFAPGDRVRVTVEKLEK
jgi:hypothetical protein